MHGFGIFVVGCLVSLTLVAVICILAERIAKGYVPVMIAGLLAGVTILADIMASAKLVDLQMFGMDLVADAGIFVFPVILLGQDYLNEFYGKKAAQVAVWSGFMAKIYLAIMLPFLISNFFPWSIYATELQEASKITLALGARISIASIIAYFLSGFTNVYVYDRLKVITKNKKKWLWVRNNVSSNVAMLFDNILFCFIAFGGVLPFEVVWGMVLAGILLKWMLNWLDTIFLYIMYWFKENGIISGEHHLKHPEEAVAEGDAS